MKHSEITDKEAFKKSWINYVKTMGEIDDLNYLSDIFEANYKDRKVEIYNSVTGKTSVVKSHRLLDTIIEKCVLVENGVLFYNHQSKLAPVVRTYNMLKNSRKANKNLMKKAMSVNDSLKALFYDNSQGDDKLFLNTYYGIQLNPFSRFYNYDVAGSTTIRGRSTVSMNGLSIEMLFGRYRPYDLENYLHFINEVCKKNIFEYLEYLKVPTTEEVLQHLLLNKYEDYYGKDILKNKIDKLSDVDKIKLYYASNFKEIVKTDYASKLIHDIFKIQNNDYHKINEWIKNDDPNRFKNYKNVLYLDPLEPSENVKELVDELIKFISLMIKGYYWYEGDHTIDGEYLTSTQEIFKTIERDRIIVTDTDSLIVYILTLMNDIKDNVPKLDEVTNEFDELMLSYTLDSIIVAVLSNVLAEGLWRYTTQSFIPENYRHIISYKQEFLFRTLQVTEGAKNYLGIIGIQEGVFLKKEKPEIKGLSLKKSNFNKKLSDIAKEISIDYVAKKDIPDVKGILNKVEAERKNILDLYKSKDNIELFTINKLKTGFNGLPEGESRIKACRLYEALFDKEINLPGSFIESKISFGDREEELEENYPDEFKRLTRVALNRSREANRVKVYNKAIAKFEDESKFPIEVKNYLSEIVKCKDVEEIKQIVKDYKNKDDFIKDAIGSSGAKIVKIKDIDKIALPLDTETIPPFITEFIDDNGVAVFENLASVIIKGIGLEVVRNKSKRQIITNVVSYY